MNSGEFGVVAGSGGGGRGEGLPLGEREEAEAAQFAAEHASYWTSELHRSSEQSKEEIKSRLNMTVETHFLMIFTP